MAGIYVHIPFCKQACHYCDFHFSTSSKSFDEFVSALLHEIELQKEYLKGARINTLYFGGGTPSLLPAELINSIISKINEVFPFDNEIELTLEANPDDLSHQKLKELKHLGINRLSIGVQSFQPDILQFLNRAHNEEEAIQCIENAYQCGFENINIDLIYGIVEDNHLSLENDLEIISELSPAHISAYCLTIEPKTVFGNWSSKGKLKTVSENYAALQFEKVREEFAQLGYEQYEVSNFARDKLYSTHNSNYWQSVPYLGIGPSAHSFNGSSRQFNISNNARYIKELSQDNIPAEVEVLDKKTQANEFIMTGLRTKWGCDLAILKDRYEYDLLRKNERVINSFQLQGLLKVDQNKLVLTKKGLLVADEIIAELFQI